MKEYILNTENDNKMIFVRFIVGLVFISEGIQKYLILQVLGSDRFTEIGFTHAFFWVHFTGAFEMSCGLLLLLGLITRLATIPLLIIMVVAFITTKLPLLAHKGFWTFAHEYSIDFSMTLLLILLLIYGGGSKSVDLKLFKSATP